MPELFPDIAIVSANPAAQEPALAHLKQSGWTAVVCPQEEAASVRARAVLLELEGGDASEVALQIKAASGIPQRPVVALVPVHDDVTAVFALEAGAADVMRLPVAHGELVARLRMVLRNHDAVAEFERKEHDAQAMVELTQALASSLDFREILFTVVRRIAEVVRVDRVSLVLSPQEGEVGFVVAASDDERLTNLRIDLSKYPEIQQVLRTHAPLVIQDAKTDPLLDGVRDGVVSAKLSPLALLPIVFEDQAMGVLFLRAVADRGALSERELQFCRVVANTTAVALRNARTLSSLRADNQQMSFAKFEAERRLGSLKRYADLFASSADGIAVVDASGALLFANPRAYEMLGYTEGEVTARRLKEFVQSSDHELAAELWRGFKEGVFPKPVDLGVVRKDGVPLVVSCAFSRLGSGPDAAVLITFRDVTEERRTAAELVRTKEFLESLIDASVDAIVASDMRGTIILFNKGAERIYGYRGEDVVGKMHVSSLYADGVARDIIRAIRSPQHGGEGRLDSMQIEAIDARGQRIPIAISAAFITEGGKPVATFGIFKDLREKIRVEERLAHAQQKLAVTEKQALIAEMAGAFAHELNQPLTSVTVYAEILRRKLAADSQEHQAADMILRESERMANIVKKIGKITKYETTTYVGQQKILDLDRATAEGSQPPPKREP